MIFCTIKENSRVMEYRENDKLIASAVGEYKVIIYANYAYTRIGIGYG